MTQKRSDKIITLDSPKWILCTQYDESTASSLRGDFSESPKQSKEI